MCLVPRELPYKCLFFQNSSLVYYFDTTNPVCSNGLCLQTSPPLFLLISSEISEEVRVPGGCRDAVLLIRISCPLWSAAESKGPAALVLLALIYRTCPVMQMLSGSLRKCQHKNNSCSLPTDINLNHSTYDISKFRNLHGFLTIKVHFLFMSFFFKHSNLLHHVLMNALKPPKHFIKRVKSDIFGKLDIPNWSIKIYIYKRRYPHPCMCYTQMQKQKFVTDIEPVPDVEDSYQLPSTREMHDFFS